ncbi:MAG: T9SS type A sorting domain-containing protein, partial [bacterium]
VEYAASPAHTWAVRVGCLTQKYTLRGRIRNAQSGLPVPMAEIHIPETNQITRADSSGLFTLGAPFPSITLDFSAFAYRDTSYSIILTAYGSDSIEIFIQPEIISSISGLIRDNAGNGIASRLDFFAQGNPSPLPYAVALSDTDGYYQVQTIVGVYDIEVRPEAPYLFRRLENISLTSSSLQLDIFLETAEFLLVDDDGNKPYEQYYITTLQAFHNTYFLWETDSLGPPPARVREAFPSRLMIWFTGDTSHAPLTVAEQTEIRDHLKTGGRLFLTGQDIAEYSHAAGILDTLGIAFSSNTALAQVRGIPNSLISNGLVLLIDGPGGADNQHSQDMLTIVNPLRTSSIFSYGSNTTRIAGVSYIHEIFGQQAVFLGFGFEAITSETDRQTLLRRILEFMQIPVSIENFSASIPKQIRLFQNYPNPFNPTTVISWQLAVGSHVHLTIYNLQGRRVKTLLSAFQLAGFHSIDFDASDLASGIYFYRLEAGRDAKTKKMVVLK